MDGLRIWQQGRHWLAGLMVVALAACGGSGGGSTYTPGATTGPASVTVTTIAGQINGADGSSTAASFGSAGGSVVVGSNLYVVDTGAHTIRKVVIATGEVSTLAGSPRESGAINGIGSAARFNYPYNIASDGTHLYVTDGLNALIRKIVISTGEVSTLAGGGNGDGTGTAAGFSSPYGIVFDSGNLYVADYGDHTIRKIVIDTKVVTTLAGTAGFNGNTNGTGAAARFSYPQGITSDGTHLFVADNYTGLIRKIIISTGEVTTLAGGGTGDNTGTAAGFDRPSGITSDGNGNLYVTDGEARTIRKIVINSGEVSTVAGTVSSFFSTTNYVRHVDGVGSSARFISPGALALSAGNLLISDGQTIRKMTLTDYTVSTLAGRTYDADGIGNAARFSFARGIGTDGTNLYIGDGLNNKIRKFDPASNTVTTLAGGYPISGSCPRVPFSNGIGAVVTFCIPGGSVAVAGNLYVADSENGLIRKIVLATGEVSTFAGGGTGDGSGTSAGFSKPTHIVTDGSNLYVTDSYGGHAIRKIVIATAQVSTLAGELGSTGSTDGTGSAARFNAPTGLAISADNITLYVTDSQNHTIRKIVIATGVVSTIAGTAGSAGNVDGTGSVVRLSRPAGITLSGDYLYVGSEHLIRRVNLVSGAVDTLAGSSRGFADGAGTSAKFGYELYPIMLGGNLYVLDGDNGLVRKITGL